jgi:hypothetical protein
MYSFSLEKSISTKPIAIIKGGDYNDHLVYIKNLDHKCCNNHNLECNNNVGRCCKKCAFIPDMLDVPRADTDLLPLFNKYKGEKKIEMMKKIKKCIAINKMPIDDDEISIYNEVKRKCELISDIKITNGYFEQYPNTSINCDKTNNRDVLYASGAGGSGKSTYISRYLKNYKLAFPHRDIYVFSRHTDEQEIDKLKPIKVPINEKLLTMKLDLDMMKDSCVVFDDCGAIPDKKINDFLYKLMNDLLENSRHHNINICVTSHVPSNYTKTRLLLAEMTHFILFNTGSRKQIDYVLTNYLGFTKQQLKELYKLNTRWWCISKLNPQWVMYERGIYLL